MIDDLAAARAIHVLAVVHWIGGMAAVTTHDRTALRATLTGRECRDVIV
jgi:uncharacterized membrane protein